MKSNKTVSALMALAMTALSASPVLADSVALKLDVGNSSLYVSGELNDDRSNAGLVMRLKDSAGADTAAEFTASYLSGGEMVFEFPELLLPDNLATGDYTIEISGVSLSSPITLTYSHAGADKLLDILTDINSATDKGSVITSNSAVLGFDSTEYTSLSDEGKAVFESVMSSVTYDVPTDSASAENRDKIKAETKKMADAYNWAICAANYSSIKGASGVSAWVERYLSDLGFDKDDSNTAYDEAKIAGYLKDVMGDGDFVRRIENSKSFTVHEDMKAYLYESALLATIKEKSSNAVKEMIFSFPELFPIDKGVFNSLSKMEQAQCFVTAGEETYETYAEATKGINDIIGADTPSTGNTRPSGGGGGGGGSVKLGNQAPVVQPSEQKTVFSDVTESHWAYEAVNGLFERKIVSGRGESLFAPDEFVTRAEFIKMVVLAMGLKTGGTDTAFGDVPENAWFAPYIAAAEKEGIINGDEKGNFNPDDRITRQDMVTILYRALGVTSDSGDTSVFSDSADISGYAKEAVAYFTAKNIVNGLGDGRFGARENATRAQTAAVLYRIVSAESIY